MKVEIKMKNRNISGLKKHLLSVHKNESQKLFPRKQVKQPTSDIANFFQSAGQVPISHMEEAMSEVQQKQLKILTTALNNLRITEVLTDVILVCEEQRFPANRVILAASCSYFAEMFQESSSNNSMQECIQIHRIPADMMKILLDFVYIGKISIDETDIMTLMALCTAACELQLNLLVEHCCNLVLAQSPASDVVSELRKIVHNLNDIEIKNRLPSCLTQNVLIDYDSDEFLALPLDGIIKILSNNDPENNYADKVLQAVVNWITYDTDNRKMHASCVLPYVNVNELSDEVLLQMQQMEKVRSCHELIMFALDSMAARFQRQRSRSSRNSVSSLASSVTEFSSFVSSVTESNDILQNDCYAQSREESEHSLVSPLQTPNSLQQLEAAGVGKGSVVQMTNKAAVHNQQTKQKTSESVLTKTKRVLESLELENQHGSLDSSPAVKKNSPLATSHSFKNDSLALTPKPPVRSSVRDVFEAKKASADVLVSPKSIPDGRNADCQKIKSGLNSGPAKPQRTVTDLNLLTLGCMRSKNVPVQPTDTINKKCQTSDIQRNENDRPGVNSTDDVRNQAKDDLFIRLDTAIRRHVDTRNVGFRRNAPYNHSFDQPRSNERFGSHQITVRNGPRTKVRDNHSLERMCSSERYVSHPTPMKNGPRNNAGKAHSLAQTHHSEAVRNFGTISSQNRSSSSERSFNHYRNSSRSSSHSSERYVNCEPHPKHNVISTEDTLKNSTTSSSPKEFTNQSCRSRSRIKVPVTSQQQHDTRMVFVLENGNQEWMLQAFDLETNNMTRPVSLKTEIFRHSALVSSGQVIYFLGGATDTWEVLKTVLMYDSHTAEWQRLADLETARWDAGAAKLENYMYVVGGVGEENVRLSQVERYDPASDTWISVASMKTCREDPSVVVIHNLLCVIGGYVVYPQQSQLPYFDSNSTAAGELYNPETDQWTEIVTPFVVGREIHEKTFCTSLLHDKIYAIRKHTGSANSNSVKPVLYELDLQSKSCHPYEIANPELRDVLYICSTTEDQLCLVTEQGNVYVTVLKPTGLGDIQLQKCFQHNQKGLVYAVSASK